MRILVTGGAGFLGSHLARRLIADGHRVVIADDLSTGRRENLPAGARFVRMDVSRRQDYRRLPGGRFHAALHLAAQSSGEASFADPERDERVNLHGTMLLLEWCRLRRVPRFLFASSMSVYGAQPARPVREDAPCRPVSFYGVHKLAAEQAIRIHALSHPLGFTVFRIFNAYGPGQNLRNLRQGMVSIYLAYLLRRRPIHVKGSLSRFRDFLYVDDAVEAWVRALRRPASIGKTYNLASGKKVTVRRLLRLLLAAAGEDPAEYPKRVAGSTPGDIHGLYADIRAIQADLDWRPRVPLAEGLRRMVAWYRER